MFQLFINLLKSVDKIFTIDRVEENAIKCFHILENEDIKLCAKVQKNVYVSEDRFICTEIKPVTQEFLEKHHIGLYPSSGDIVDVMNYRYMRKYCLDEFKEHEISICPEDYHL